MRIGLIWMILFWMPFTLLSQQWAGPDKEVCEIGTPKTLGSSDPCPNCCYSWTPAEGLSCTTCKNPQVNVKDTTEYTVEVRDQHLKLLGTDKVIVNSAFGNIHFTPGHAIQGSDETVEAKLLTLSTAFDPHEITWDFIGDDLHALLEAEDEGDIATITPGPYYGKVKIEAVYNGNYDGECKASAELDINNGVKDVWATDHNSPTRVAKNGETLILLDEGIVDISAKPNEGGFVGNIPDWKPDDYGSMTPADGLRDFPIYEMPLFAPGKISEYIAGDDPTGEPRVKVIRRKALNPTVTPLDIPGIDTLGNLIKNYFTFFKADEVTIPCGALEPFEITADVPTIEGTWAEVEKYNNTGTGTKQTFKVVAAISASGKIFHPAFTKTFSFHHLGVDLFLCSRLYAELKGSMEFNLEFKQNDSLPDPTWKPIDPTLAASFEVSGNLEFAFTPPGYLITASARMKGSLGVTFTYEQALNKITHKLKIDPITAKAEANIQQETDPGKYEDVLGGLLNKSKTIIMFEGHEFGPWDTYQFTN